MNSVTLWIRAFERHDDSAAQALFDKYFERLVALARRKMSKTSRRVIDEEDVAITAFHELLACIRSGSVPQVKDRKHLWRLLVKITEHRAFDAIRKLNSQRRGAGRVRGESVFVGSSANRQHAGIAEIPDEQPSPEFADCMAEEYQHLMARLEDDGLRKIAGLVMAGYSTAEIAEKINRTQRTVQRRIKMIQQVWSDAYLAATTEPMTAD